MVTDDPYFNTNNNNAGIRLPRYSRCFVCGSRNPIGLDVTFYYINGRIETTLTPDSRYAGYQNIIHGGILATLLDECMGWSAIISRLVMCVAAEINIRYRVPAQVGDELKVVGELVEDKKRLVLAKGWIERADGTILCTGEGKYSPLPPQEQQKVIDYAQWGEELARVHGEIRLQEKNGRNT